MTHFALHSTLEKDSLLVMDLVLCQLRVVNDCQYPWFLLVPKVADVSDIIDLSPEQQQQLWQESASLSATLRALYQPDKLNVAALGNMVSQLHVHHIVRYTSDPAWPVPVWGKLPAKPYATETLTTTMHNLKHHMETTL